MNPLILALIASIAYYQNVEAADCYYCAKGNTSDIMKVLQVYGKSELNYDESGQYTRTYNDECGKSGKKALKTIKCPYGCIIAEYTNAHAIVAGCARDGMLLKSLSTFVAGDQRYQMAVCMNDECNDSYESATDDRVKPTSTAQPIVITTTILPQVETNATKTNETNNETPKVPAKNPRGKPNSSVSLGVSSCALLLALFAFILL